MQSIKPTQFLAIMLVLSSASRVDAVAPTKKVVHYVASASTNADPKAEPAICASLMSQYEDASKKLALNKANDAVDDSAPRATMRQTENTATIAQAQATMQLLTSNGCKAPAFAPSAERYGSASLSCIAAKEKIRAQQSMDRLDDRIKYYDEPSECDMSHWRSN